MIAFFIAQENSGKKKPGLWPGELNREVSRLGDVGSVRPQQQIAACTNDNKNRHNIKMLFLHFCHA